MQVGLHQFRSTTIEWLKGALREEGITRNVLTRSLCEHEDWRNRCGQLCVSAAAKALPVLASKLGLALPAARSAPKLVCLKPSLVYGTDTPAMRVMVLEQRVPSSRTAE